MVLQDEGLGYPSATADGTDIDIHNHELAKFSYGETSIGEVLMLMVLPEMD